MPRVCSASNPQKCDGKSFKIFASQGKSYHEPDFYVMCRYLDKHDCGVQQLRGESFLHHQITSEWRIRALERGKAGSNGDNLTLRSNLGPSLWTLTPPVLCRWQSQRALW